MPVLMLYRELSTTNDAEFQGHRWKYARLQTVLKSSFKRIRHDKPIQQQLFPLHKRKAVEGTHTALNGT